MQRVFIAGIGMAVVVAAEHADAAVRTLSGAGETVFRIGRIEPRKGRARRVDSLKAGNGQTLEQIIQIVAGAALVIGWPDGAQALPSGAAVGRDPVLFDLARSTG